MDVKGALHLVSDWRPLCSYNPSLLSEMGIDAQMEGWKERQVMVGVEGECNSTTVHQFEEGASMKYFHPASGERRGKSIMRRCLRLGTVF